MHAIVMVHKMQSMTLSNHQLLPTKSENINTDNESPINTTEEVDKSGEDINDVIVTRALYISLYLKNIALSLSQSYSLSPYN